MAMTNKRLLRETELAACAKQYRLASGKTKVEAADELGVSRPTLHLAEEDTEQSLTRVRRRMIEKYSPYEVVGPLFLLRRKGTS